MRLDCQDIADRAAPWLDQQLSPGETELVERHLDGCAACRERLELLSEQRFERPRLVQVEAPDFWRAMDDRLAQEHERLLAERAAAGPTPTSWWKREIRLSGASLAAAAALALSLAGVSAWQAARAVQADAALASVQQELERERRLSASREPTLPREPVVLVSHLPYRGSL